jgi:transcriptional regulator NrdR family protein
MTTRPDRGKLGPACPFCREHHSTVVDSRWHLATMTKRRKRHCHACNEPFYTEENALNVKIDKQSTRYSAKPTRTREA